MSPSLRMSFSRWLVPITLKQHPYAFGFDPFVLTT